ncbi:MAG: fused MFS/spermidine synthase [Myxococcota bacterium]
MLRLVALFLTVVTGFSGLVYEVSWQKYLATLLGSHSEATASVLGIFLAGLSLGYALFGRLTRRLTRRAAAQGRAPRLFLTYGVVEGGIGVYAFCFPWLFEAVRALSLSVPHGAGGLGFAFDVVLVALLLLPPTVLMGGTIPLLTQALSRDLEDATRFHALVYATNTLGAFAGALTGSFVLIPNLGLSGTMLWMSGLNLFAGVLFALFERGGAAVPGEDEVSGTAPRVEGLRLYATVGLLCGFALMVLQNVFIRLAGPALGSSEYTFATVVAVFVVCIAIGSFVVSALSRIPRLALLWNQLALVAYLGLLYLHLEEMPVWALVLRSWFGNTTADFLPYQLSVFAGFALLIGPGAILSGAVLPLLFHHLRRQVGDLGAVAGTLYSWNTVGSLLGALIGGYALLSLVDLHHVYRLAVAALAAGAALLALPLLSRTAAAATGGGLAVAVLELALLPGWNPAYVSWGLFRGRDHKDLPLASARAQARHMIENPQSPVVFHDDDPTATVVVVQTGEDETKSRSLITNGKPDGDTLGDYATMALAALVPALMVDEPEQAFVVGFGTGITVGEFAEMPSIRRVRVAEISPGVVDAAPLFDFANHGVTTHPKVEIVASDAYRTLMQSDERYDVIASEPSNPWVTGVEMLFSREFLEAARSRLTPQGVYVQWYHQYETDEEAVALVLRTYASVFDRVAVWYALGPDLLILGFNDDEALPTPEAVGRRFRQPAIREGFERSGITTLSAVLAHELMPVGVLAASRLDGPLHTLYRPILNHVAGEAFFRGALGRLPDITSGEVTALGMRNSLLRRHLADPAVDAARARREATEEACRLRKGLCLALLVEWKHLDPDSKDLREVVATINRSPGARLGGEIEPALLKRLVRLTTPTGSTARIPLFRANESMELFRWFNRYPAPFDPEALVSTWERCRGDEAACAEGLERARRLRLPERVGAR